jgi:uncharacterized protein (DUF1800 family)
MASLNAHSGLLGERLAKHLLRRATYKIDKQSIETFAAMSAEDAVEALFVVPPTMLSEPINGETGVPWINNPDAAEPPMWKQRNYLKVWWLDEAKRDTSINSKMMMFLHQYLTMHTDAADTIYVYDYLSLLRIYALGSYKTLALKIVTDNPMSSYLDNRWNHKWNPNENFAREFLELFTIGKGPQIAPGDYTNYKEEDVVTAARLLTGWRFGDRTDPSHLDPDTGITRNYTLFNYHDTDPKQFSSAFDNLEITAATNDEEMWTELEAFVDMIFGQDATAVTLCRRLYRYFVSKEITEDIETNIITPLAATCRENDYNLAITVKQLLKSEHFYNEGSSEIANKVIGNMIKSPLDNVLQMMNFFQIDPPHPVSDYENHYEDFWWWSVMDVMFEQAGFNFLEPNNVAGYPAYYQDPNYSRDWFNSATLVARYKLPEQFITGTRILSWGSLGGVTFDVVDFIQNSSVINDPADATLIVSELCNYLFPEEPDADRLDYFLNNVFLAGLAAEEWTNTEWPAYLSSGDDSGVRVALERLFTGLIYSQEYQLM